MDILPPSEQILLNKMIGGILMLNIKNLNVLRAKDAAKFLGIGKSTFHRWVQQGIIPQGIHLGARVTIWRVETLEEVLNKFADGGVK